MKVIPSGESLGAAIEGMDLARRLPPAELEGVLRTPGQYGVVRFPRQQLTGRELRDLSAQLGDLEIYVASQRYQEPGAPAVMAPSNIAQHARPIGLADAGLARHTDMADSRTSAC